MVDNRFHQLSGVAKPLARPLLWGDGLRLVNRRLVLYAACATAARDLAVGLRHHPTQPTPALAEVCDALAEAATGLTQTPSGHTPDPAVTRHLATADALLVASPPPTPAIPDPLIRPLSRLLHLLHELTGTPTLTETNTRQRSTPTPVRASWPHALEEEFSDEFDGCGAGHRRGIRGPAHGATDAAVWIAHTIDHQLNAAVWPRIRGHTSASARLARRGYVSGG